MTNYILNTESFFMIDLNKYNLPSFDETCIYIKKLNKKSVYELYVQADNEQKLLIQPRCGVGDHEKMKKLLKSLEKGSNPEILTLTSL